jgi:hypothetical protein
VVLRDERAAHGKTPRTAVIPEDVHDAANGGLLDLSHLRDGHPSHTAWFRAIRDITWIEAVDNEKQEHEIASVEEYRERLTGIIGHSLGADADVLWRDASARAQKRAGDAAKQD